MLIFYQFFNMNKDIVIFIYGMIYFLMGFGILLKNRQHSRFRLAKSLHWLALFGIFHAIADWGHLFIPIQKGYASEQAYIILRTTRIVINAISFMFLFQFGISLWQQTKDTLSKLKYLPAALFLLWFAQLFLYKSIFIIDGDPLWWVRASDIWSRYLLAFPGALLSGYAILHQREEFRKYGQTKFISMLKIAAASLFLYGVTGGLFVPRGLVSLAEIINAEFFFTLTGLPIEVLRAGAGLLMSFSMLKIIQVFDKEYIARIQESEKERAIFEERNRIAQDLHDGIIQSIYATNLQLEVVRQLITKNPVDALEKLAVSLSKKNEIISQIRQYIGELKRVTDTNLSFRERIEELLDEMGTKERLKVKLDYSFEKDDLSITVLYHLSLVMKEAISNVMKHSEAKELRIKIRGDDSELHVKISDDGIGFSPENVPSVFEAGEKQGILNMKNRIKTLNGEFEIQSAKKKGTTIRMRIPLLGGLHDKTNDS